MANCIQNPLKTPEVSIYYFKIRVPEFRNNKINTLESNKTKKNNQKSPFLIHVIIALTLKSQRTTEKTAKIRIIWLKFHFSLIA